MSLLKHSALITAMLLLMGLALGPANLWAQAPNFTLKGKLGTLDAPALVELSYHSAGKQVVASAPLTKGVFTLSGYVTGPEPAYLVVFHEGKDSKTMNSDVRRLYLEPGTITLTSPDSLKKATITGSPINADDKVLSDALQPNLAKARAFVKKNGYLTPDQPQDPAFVARYNQAMDELDREKKAVQRRFIETHPNSWISLGALQSYAVPKFGTIPNPADIEPLYNSLGAKVKSSALGKEYQASIAKWKSVGIGSPAPEFTQIDPTGKPVRLADFQGKYVLIDFWASWCHPCRAENPNLIQQYNLYKDKNFTIVGISMDGEKQRDAWLKAIQQDGLPWPQAYDLKPGHNNEAVIRYGVQSIPQNFLVDPTGKIIAEGLRGEELNRTLKALLDK